MQEKQLCINQKYKEGKKKSTSLHLFYSTEKEGGFYTSARPLRNNLAAELTDLVTWPDLYKK